MAAGRIEDLGPYEPAAYRLTLYDPFDGGGVRPGRPWPWPHLDPGDFERSDAGLLTTVISAADARLIADPPTSAPDDIVLAAPDGTPYLIRLRALLPDEIPTDFGEQETG